MTKTSSSSFSSCIASRFSINPCIVSLVLCTGNQRPVTFDPVLIQTTHKSSMSLYFVTRGLRFNLENHFCNRLASNNLQEAISTVSLYLFLKMCGVASLGVESPVAIHRILMGLHLSTFFVVPTLLFGFNAGAGTRFNTCVDVIIRKAHSFVSNRWRC